MNTNKLTLELELPSDLTDKESASLFLFEQLEYTVQVLKDQLKYFKEKDLTVPTISLRGLPKNKKEVDQEFEKFKTTLLDWILKFQPKINVAQQIKVIKELYAFDKPAEEWIERFEASRAEWAATTWFTVKHHLSKVKEKEPEEGFARKELDDKDLSSIMERVKGYGSPKE